MERIKHFLRHNAWVVVLDILAFVFSYLLALYIRFTRMVKSILDSNILTSTGLLYLIVP